MPVYEFSCKACGASVSVFVRSMSSPVNGVCDRCGSSDLQRLISRFAVMRSPGTLGAMDDPSFLDNLDPNDPQAMASAIRRMQQEMGAEAGPEFDEMAERLERGESLAEGFGNMGDDFGGYDDDF